MKKFKAQNYGPIMGLQMGLDLLTWVGYGSDPTQPNPSKSGLGLTHAQAYYWSIHDDLNRGFNSSCV